MDTIDAMRGLTVRPADADDAPSIIRLRDEYYARAGRPVQIRDTSHWVVAELNGVVGAVQAYFANAAAPSELWITDTYADRDRRGKLCLAAIAQWLHSSADGTGQQLFGMTELDNHVYNDAIARRGWECVGYLWHRAPREK